jgi:hypothetical protein
VVRPGAVLARLMSVSIIGKMVATRLCHRPEGKVQCSLDKLPVSPIALFYFLHCTGGVHFGPHPPPGENNSKGNFFFWGGGYDKGKKKRRKIIE